MAAREKTEPPLRILIIGSLPPPLGGTAVSLKHLVDCLTKMERAAVSVVNTSGIRGHGLKGVLRFFAVLGRIVKQAFRADVLTLHCATTALPLLGLVLLVVARISGKPLIVRKFAGWDYWALGPVRGRLAHFVVRRADLYLAQTRHLVNLAKQRGVRRVEWYPTNRPMPPEPFPENEATKPCRRFVFAGRVNEVKGIREILELDARLPESLSVAVFGPFTGKISENDFKGCRRVRYEGVLKPDAVIPALQQYDALLLPTYYPGEGYPGAILEAYAAGIPVICSRWMAIPEIVDETCGILVEPGSADALYEAIRRVTEDEALFARLKAGARARSRLFSTEIWAERLVAFCETAAGAKKIAAAPQ